MTTVRLPILNMLAVDFAASLFRLTLGDVETGDVESAYVFKVVNLERFETKLKFFAERSDDVLRGIFNLLGGHFVTRDCNVNSVQELAKLASQRPSEMLRHLSAVEMNRREGVVEVLWGEEPFVKNPPPLLQSVEFMEGVRAWPVEQLDVAGSGARAKTKSGFRRTVRPSCMVLGALALGVSATYVAGSQRQRNIRFLIPLCFVEYDAVATRLVDRLGRLGLCDLPEPLMRLIISALAGRPAVFRLVDIAYSGGIDVQRDSSRELVVDTKSLGRHLSTLHRHADALLRLAEQWCLCDKRGWPDECRDVSRAGVVAAEIYLYAETGRLEHAYEALSVLLRLSRDVGGGLTRLVEEMV